ncbi:MAG: cyclic nucleotide-binding/CBS domain-containing protein [Caldilineaceae bacterium]|nr:cyclic nucleotide-binding/CBS domain-containing protein [Caldilineaceae bacterium]
MQLRAFLGDCPPFDRLTDAELTAATAAFDAIRVARDVRILTQGGAPSDYLYLIGEGEATLSSDGQILQILKQGDLFGYPSVLGETAPLHNVDTTADSLLYRLPEADFRRALENSTFSRYFFSSLSERLRRAFAQSNAAPDLSLAMAVKHIANLHPLFIPPAATVQQAAQAMRTANASSALIDGETRGIVTDRDLRNRVLAEGLPPTTSVQKVMSAPLVTLDSDATVFGALTVMLEKGIHHLALAEEGEIMGVVSADDFIRQQARGPLYLQQKLERATAPALFHHYAEEITTAVDSLARSGLNAAEIGRIISRLNDTLVARLAQMAEAEMGPPPVFYAWIVFGSEGRSEQMLLTDQDNGLVYAADEPGAGAYFAALAERVANGLIGAGFPPCPGGYMATNWCKPLDEWQSIFSRWIGQPTPEALMEASIFFDFRPVYGDLSLESLEAILSSARNNGLFIGHMVRAAQSFNPPLGFFNRLRSDDGRIDIKHGGIAPIVGLARACALAAGSRERSTLERLVAAADAGAMSREGADNLAETFQFLLRLRLKEQMAAIRAGKPPSNDIVVDDLSSLEKRHLRDALLVIRQMQDGVGSAYNTDVLR